MIQLISVAFGLTQIVMLFLFLRLVRAADAAMDKTGIGNLALWQQYNDSASDALLWLLMAWMGSLAFAYVISHPFRKHMLIWFGFIMPLVAACAYVASLLLFPVHSDV